MPRESKSQLKARAARIVRSLHRLYPDAECSLDHVNPLQLLVATILSAQCTDERVNKVTPSLFARFPDAKAFADADIADLEEAVRSTGFYRNKARSIQNACRDIVSRHGSQVPRTMEELTRLAGVGRKTANVILGVAFGDAVGVVVDTHVGRLARRMALTGKDQQDPEKVERNLMDVVARKEWIFLAHALIQHGRRVCDARKPDCNACSLSDLCPSAFTFEHNKK
ncbi:MAG: Endonuclease III [Phycisphaerae bacterium]|nr:Endonuclease III [Phycisphaerae bacterium]